MDYQLGPFDIGEALLTLIAEVDSLKDGYFVVSYDVTIKNFEVVIWADNRRIVENKGSNVGMVLEEIIDSLQKGY